MKQIGITGGIGAGKSTVARMFQEMGIPVYYSDDEAKEIMNTDKEVIQKITELFGEEAYVNGEYNRKFIADKVFTDKMLLEELNSITHPVIHKHYENWVSKQKSKYILLEAAILIETGSYKNLDGLIVVTAPENVRLERVVERDNTCMGKVLDRIKNQISEEERIKYADYLINNDGEDLNKQVKEIHEQIK